MKNPLFLLLGAALLAALPGLTACATKPAPPAPAPPGLAVPVLPAGEIAEPEPELQEPEFTISSIAILQAELINTRFKVSLRIDNPNSFPLELSAFSYELYGGDRYWADGTDTAVMQIPPEDFAEKELFLMMNFINMKREVLDQIVALKSVRYRFSGDVTVSTGIESLPRFTMRFDRSGESPVAR